MSSEDLLRAVAVAPSILSADFGRLGEQVGEVLSAGARIIHVDVMDGHFVPSISLGPIVVAALREQVERVGGMLDVHLMIERPERMVPEFLRAGAHSITFHAEATPHLAYTASLVREGGASVGVAINPATGVTAVADLTGAIDLALCMTVNPGWGGQRFIEHSLAKIERLRGVLDAGEREDEAGHAGEERGAERRSAGGGSARRVALEVDGGIDRATAGWCRAAGANLFVAGSAIFRAADPGRAYREIATALKPR